MEWVSPSIVLTSGNASSPATHHSARPRSFRFGESEVFRFMGSKVSDASTGPPASRRLAAFSAP